MSTGFKLEQQSTQVGTLTLADQVLLASASSIAGASRQYTTSRRLEATPVSANSNLTAQRHFSWRLFEGEAVLIGAKGSYVWLSKM